MTREKRGKMEELKDRQKRLLGMIVDAYISTVGPVGSKSIAQYYDGKVSPATIRNEMHDLEARGYITHPHTSAGRVPTDKGYRYYVDYLMPDPALNQQDVMRIKREFEARIENLEELIDRTSKILAVLSEQAGIVLYPNFESLVLKRIDLTQLGLRHVLVVWTAENGFIQSRVIDMEREIAETDLKRLNIFLNGEIGGLPLSEIKGTLSRKLTEARDSIYQLYREACRIVLSSFPDGSLPKILVGGSHFMLEKPEFKSWEKSKNLMKALELRDSLLEVIRARDAVDARVQIQIGEEHHCADLWDCSFVTTQYFVHGRPIGMLGILGPRRMAYNRAVGLVGFMSEFLGGFLERGYGKAD